MTETDHTLVEYRKVPFVKESNDPQHYNSIAVCSCGWFSDECIVQQQAERAHDRHRQDVIIGEMEAIEARKFLLGQRLQSVEIDPLDPNVAIYHGGRYSHAVDLVEALMKGLS